MKIKGKEVDIKITGETLIHYKQVFKKDFLKTIQKLGEEMDYTDMFEIVYILYKEASKDGMSYSDYENVFMKDLSLGEVLSEDAMTEISSAIAVSMGTTKEVKKKEVSETIEK